MVQSTPKTFVYLSKAATVDLMIDIASQVRLGILGERDSKKHGGPKGEGESPALRKRPAAAPKAAVPQEAQPVCLGPCSSAVFAARSLLLLRSTCAIVPRCFDHARLHEVVYSNVCSCGTCSQHRGMPIHDGRAC